MFSNCFQGPEQSTAFVYNEVCCFAILIFLSPDSWDHLYGVRCPSSNNRPKWKSLWARAQPLLPLHRRHHLHHQPRLDILLPPPSQGHDKGESFARVEDQLNPQVKLPFTFMKLEVIFTLLATVFYIVAWIVVLSGFGWCTTR